MLFTSYTVLFRYRPLFRPPDAVNRSATNFARSVGIAPNINRNTNLSSIKCQKKRHRLVSFFLALPTGLEPVVRLATSPHFRHIRDLIRCVAAHPRPPSSLHRKQSGSAPSEIRGSLYCIKKSLALLYKRLWLSQLGSNQ